ncbi:MAG: PD-(D/E)XK nuclease family transposase [Lachnospiraceae bacterium]|nr:PD-(D/E)XK nuclease family transposase [Lachnospiraceae bacterium]
MAMKKPLGKVVLEEKNMPQKIETEEDLIRILKAEGLMDEFQRLSEAMQKDLVDFCTGQKGLNIRSDPMFKTVLDPQVHTKRLEEFLSLCLKRPLKILKVIPNESKRLTEDSSLLVMDMLVQLEDGELVDVEIQRIGYMFPGERVSCYLSDLLMRQYAQIKEQRKQEEKRFSYKEIKKVYCIVLIENSVRVFHHLSDQYLHRGKMVFDTGLDLDMPQECLMIPLDIFMENHQNIDNKLDAWLYFIASDKLEDIRKVIKAYPEFRELYEEIFQFRYHVKELIGMYSEALSILDANTVQYMVEQQQEELERQAEELKRQAQELEDKDRALEAQRKMIEELRAQMAR